MGDKTAERGLSEMSDGLKKLQAVAESSGDTSLIAFIAEARSAIQDAKSNLAKVRYGLQRFMR